MEKAIFFDRDGTLIEDKIYLNDPNDIVYLPGVFEALTKLKNHGYKFVIMTNQSGIARGIVDVKNLNQIHKNIGDEFAKHDIEFLDYFYAPYLTSSNHYYRKPATGMIDEGCEAFNLDPKKSWTVGDRMTDVEAGHRAGAKGILLSQLEDPKDFDFAPPDAHVDTLDEVAEFIINNS